ncbi:MAG: hypothetical protein WCP30_01850 [Mycobacteriaceae bacterium]
MGPRLAAILAAAMTAGYLAGPGVAAADPDTPVPPPPATDAAAPPDHAAPGSAPPAPGPAGPGPQTVMNHDGTFTVGKDILPGVYTSPGPLPGDSCYWRRIAADNTTLENALSKQPQTVQIDAADMAFKTKGCQPWQLTDGAAPPNQNPPWLSQLQLRHDLDILNGLAGQSGNGQLPPY